MNIPPLLSAQATPLQTPVQSSQAQTQQTLPIADIHLPDAVSPWPPAIGWWLLLALIIALCAGSVYALKRYQRKWRYRRAALSLLKQQYQQWQEHEEDLSCATAMIAIVKRTAITAYSEDSAALFGQAWVDFLNQQTTKAYFSDSLAQWMSEQQYQAHSTQQLSNSTQQASDDKLDIPQLYKACENWIKHHRVQIKLHGVKETPLGESA